jgi:hypothetical protein
MPEQRNTNNNNRDKRKAGRDCSKSKGKDKLCRYCKKTNHNIDDYWRSAEQGETKRYLPSKNKSDGDGKVVVVSSDNYDGECLLVFVVCVYRDDEWILDTTC